MKRKAFTVIDLLVVIAIVALLAVVVGYLVGCDDKPATPQQQAQPAQAAPAADQPPKPEFTIPNATWIVKDNVLKFPSIHKSGQKVFDGCLQRWQEKHPEYEVVSMSSQPGDDEWIVYTYVTIKRKAQ